MDSSLQIPKGWFVTGDAPKKYEIGLDSEVQYHEHPCVTIKSRPYPVEFAALAQMRDQIPQGRDTLVCHQTTEPTHHQIVLVLAQDDAAGLFEEDPKRLVILGRECCARQTAVPSRRSACIAAVLLSAPHSG